MMSAVTLMTRGAHRLPDPDYVEYLPIDLNDEAWPQLARWLGAGASSKSLVLLEGVCCYINDSNFRQFLQFLAAKLPAGSLLAYDFKIRGIRDDFGRAGRTLTPFRLSHSRDEVASFHQGYGFRLEQMELSCKLCARLLPGLAESASSRFTEDALIRLQVAGA